MTDRTLRAMAWARGAWKSGEMSGNGKLESHEKKTRFPSDAVVCRALKDFEKKYYK